MAVIRKIPVLWQGFPGAPGFSVFYAPDSTDAVASIKTFFTTCRTEIPTGVSLTIPFAGDSISDTTGELGGSWTSPNGGVVTCVGSGAYAAGTGAFVRWLTGGIVNGRRVKGHTFLCPLIAADYDTVGSLSSTALSTLSGAAAVLGAANTLVVWARPFTGTVSDPVPRAGSSHAVIAGTVPDQVTSLRSRRT